jgi:hypothetical protein
LTNLEQALQGLRPLITIDAATTALPFTSPTAWCLRGSGADLQLLPPRHLPVH